MRNPKLSAMRKRAIANAGWGLLIAHRMAEVSHQTAISGSTKSMQQPTYEELQAENARLRAALAPATVAPSPRQLAIAAGEAWYQPTTPCVHGHLAPRRVSNGACRQCEDLWRAAQRHVPAGLPDNVVIDRTSAQARGLTVYRTGKPCKHGHMGWRYVSTRACVECYRG